MSDKPSLDTIMRWISHYAEATATLHRYESERYRDDEKAVRWRQIVDGRRSEVETALRDLMTTAPAGLRKGADA